MSVERKDVYVCDYDGVDTATVYGSIELPAGWAITMDPADGATLRYWHNATHTENGGRASGVLGGVYSGGLTTTWVFTDDQDATTSEQSTNVIPTGWMAVLRRDGTYVHFKDQTNTAAWFAANGANP